MLTVTASLEQALYLQHDKKYPVATINMPVGYNRGYSAAVLLDNKLLQRFPD